MDLFKDQTNEFSGRQPDVIFETLDHQTSSLGNISEKQNYYLGSDVPDVTPSISNNFTGSITFNYFPELSNSIYYNISLYYLLILCRFVHF